MDQKWLLTGVILAALSLSGCNNSLGSSAKSAANIKAAKASTHAVAGTPGNHATAARDMTALPASDISGRSLISPQHAENGGGEDTGRSAGQPAAAVASNNPDIARQHAPKVPKMGGSPMHRNATEPALASAENHGGVPVNARGVHACGVLDSEERPVLGAAYPGVSGAALANLAEVVSYHAKKGSDQWTCRARCITVLLVQIATMSSDSIIKPKQLRQRRSLGIACSVSAGDPVSILA